MHRQVIIVGAGGHAKVVADIVRLSGSEIAGFLDDRDPAELSDYNVLGKISDIMSFSDTCEFIPGIGNNKIRQRIMETYPVHWCSAIHPTAVLSDSVTVQGGTVIMANAVINSGSMIGRGVIINTAATVDHDNILHDYVHLSPGVHLAGTVEIGCRSWVGIGGIVINNVMICADCTIGAGSVVLKDIEQAGVYVGVPAHKVNSNI